jgi:DNA invertase Pin-like site-specific DNA recombinase
VLIKRGVRVLAADGDDVTDDRDPARKMMRQVASAFAEYEKPASSEGSGGRRAQGHQAKVEGLKSCGETHAALVASVRDMRSQGQTLQAIAAALAERGHLNHKGHPFAPTQIARMCERREYR